MRRHAVEQWLLRAASHRETAALEWAHQGVALLTAGIAWDIVRAPYDVLATDFDRGTVPERLRHRLNELALAGTVFCDSYRPLLYFMVPPGTDQQWPRALSRARVECLGGTQSYTHHIGVPRVDFVSPPGLFWLTLPESGSRRHVDPKHLFEVLQARVDHQESPASDGAP